MFTNKEINDIKTKYTEEEINKIIYYLNPNNIMELKEIGRKKAKNEFVRKIRLYTNRFIKLLGENIMIKRETINLLLQAKDTLNNVHNLIKKNEIVDAYVLLRAAFENVIMGMMITEDEEVYKEFINLSINDSTRKLTKPQTLRNNFRKVLKKLDGELFKDVSNKNLKNMLDDFYDEMCLFTHSTILVNAVVEIKKYKDEEVCILALKQTTYFMEIILYLCLKKLSNYKKNPIDITYALIGWWILISDIPKEKLTEDRIEKINKLLHSGINEQYMTKNKKKGNKLAEATKEMQEQMVNNPMLFIDLIGKMIK